MENYQLFGLFVLWGALYGRALYKDYKARRDYVTAQIKKAQVLSMVANDVLQK